MQSLVEGSVRESQGNMKSAIQMYVLLESFTNCIFSCHSQACPDGAVNFRDVQCADTNDTPFGGELLTWESFKGECT